MKKMLVVLAHPDDESFATGGTIAKYASNGWQIDLICATPGEAGSSGPYQARGRQLGEIRQKELTEAASILGIATVTLLDYRDGTLSQHHPGEVEDKVYRLMGKLEPRVVITFEPMGISNHPDHIKLSLATTYAFQKYADSRPRAKPDENPKLYYVCLPETVAMYFKRRHITPEESFGKPWRGTPDKFITTVIDISRFRTTKVKALKAHVSQEENVQKFLSLVNNPLFGHEHYILRLVGTQEAFLGKHDRLSSRL